jgi:hypothetical protein
MALYYRSAIPCYPLVKVPPCPPWTIAQVDVETVPGEEFAVANDQLSNAASTMRP